MKLKDLGQLKTFVGTLKPSHSKKELIKLINNEIDNCNGNSHCVVIRMTKEKSIEIFRI
jgi:hypothetical protein